jgi:serine phosphatase RsbU (regulator of sigma subunit)
MRILIGWDDPTEAELLTLYLGLDDAHEVVLAANREELRVQSFSGHWDICLLSLTFPDLETSFAAFLELQDALPGCPIVGGCQSEEMLQLAKYLVKGMRAYVIRDANRDFLFLIRATLESIYEAVKAERERQLVERLREEIDSVRKLQEAIIPRELFSPRGYHICARYEPSQIQVVGGQPVILAGGDYYDVFPIDENNVVVLIGDASGHGMKACMSIVAMHTLVRLIRGQQYCNTASFMAEVNNRLCEQHLIQAEGGFITLMYGILHTDRNEFQWTSAGHPMPLLQNLQTGEIHLIGEKDSAGVPLGIFTDMEYESARLTLPPKHRLLLYTDGLIEAMTGSETQGLEFGVPGVETTMRRSAHLSLEQATAALFDDSLAFTNGMGRHDDTSVVMIERPPLG